MKEDDLKTKEPWGELKKSFRWLETQQFQRAIDPNWSKKLEVSGRGYPGKTKFQRFEASTEEMIKAGR